MTSFDPAELPLKGTSLVEASAGTGKTYTLTSLFVRLLAESDLKVSNILVVTFTEAATGELSSRIRDRIKEAYYALVSETSCDEVVERYLGLEEEEKKNVKDRFARALREFDDAAIFTIHGFCKRMLEDNAFESGVSFDSQLLKDQSALQSEIVHDFFALNVYCASPIVARYFASMNVWPENLAKLVDKATRGFDTAVVPQRTGTDDVVEHFSAAFSKARGCWQKDRDFLVDLLLNDKGLSRSRFRQSSLEKWFVEIDDYFANAALACPLALDSKTLPPLAKLTPEILQKGTKKNCVTPEHRFFECCQELVETSLAFEDLLVDFKLDLIDYCKTELRSRKLKERQWSFDDLLSHSCQALAGSGGQRLLRTVKGRYRAVLIDEFQDTDNLQYEIFSKLFKSKERPLFFIGDPKQSIYGFRGANIFTYLNAAADAGGSKSTLDTNWRSEPALIDAVNTLFGSAKSPFISDEIGYEPVSPRPEAQNTLLVKSDNSTAAFQIRFVERKEDRLSGKKPFIPKKWVGPNLPAMVACDIWSLLHSEVTIEGEPLGPSDLAVLTRTNKQAHRIRDALSEVGVPAVLFGTESVFKSDEAQELGTLIEAFSAPHRREKVKAALITELAGLNAKDIHELDSHDELWQSWETAFRHWHELWLSGDFVQAMSSFFAFVPKGRRTPIAARILRFKGGKRKLTNLRHLVELLVAACVENQLGPARLARWFCEQVAKGEGDSDSDQLRLDTDGAAVKVVTIHKAKGLEYKAVYCPYLWDGHISSSKGKEVVFHDDKEGYRRTLDLGSKDLPARKEKAVLEERQENQRLLYVALTRAKSLCIVAWGGFADADTSALCYLLHQTGNECSPADVSKRFAAMSDDEILADLERFARRAGPGTVSVRPLEEPMEVASQGLDVRSEGLRSRELKTVISSGVELYSFSALTRSGKTGDEIPAVAFEEGGVSRSPVVLDEFERGARAGNCLHAIFENIDFEVPSEEHLDGVVTKQLEVHGFDAGTWKGAVSRSVLDVLSTTISSDGPDLPERNELKLGSISKNKRIVELEFLFPVNSKDGETRLGAGDLADIMANPQFGPVSVEYASRLRELDFVLEAGFLKGFIDLVFEWQGRFYIVDYKSNYLGSSIGEYSQGNILGAMMSHDYVLQYHLYTVALHRYLENRIEGYDYDVHFGGVYYLFLRGICPETGSESGVFADRPSKELIVGLSDSFGSPKKDGGPR